MNLLCIIDYEIAIECRVELSTYNNYCNEYLGRTNVQKPQKQDTIIVDIKYKLFHIILDILCCSSYQYT